MWSTVLSVNSILCAISCWYCIFSAGASIYFLSWRPIETGILAAFLLICTEIAFGILSD